MGWVSVGCRLMLSAARGASQDAQVAVHPDLHVIIADQQLAKQDTYSAGMCNAAAVCKLNITARHVATDVKHVMAICACC